MTRTRLRQLEQIRSSVAYEDNLNMGIGAEGQPGANIETGLAVNEFTAPSTIIISGNRLLSGLNTGDQVTTSGASNGANSGTFNISTLSYNSGLNETTLVVTEATLVTEAASPATAITKTDPNKNLRRDLDHIRTQLRILNQKPNWYDVPQADDVTKYELKTGTAFSAGADIILTASETFDAGEPYTMKVYLNGQLLLPSTVNASHVVTVNNDYVERDATQPAYVGEPADRIRVAFDILANDILQFKWSKKQ